MVNMSTTFTTLANADTRDIYTKIIATVSGTNYTITGSDSICELTVEESTASDNIQLGATCSSVLKAKLRNISFTIPNATLKPYISFDNSEWCPLGVYNVADVVEKNGEYEITAYDKIAFLTDKYTPTTGTTFAQMITAMGLELETGQSVPSVSITTAYDGTERDYLGWIAGYMGRNARMNRNGKLEFVWYTEQQVELDEEVIKVNGFEKSTKDTQTITALVSGYGENPLEVGSGRTITFANPFMTQSQLQSIWNDIITSSGFEWQPCTVDTFGNPAIEVGDSITVSQDLTFYSVPIMHQEISIKGGLEIKIDSFGESDEQAIVDVGGIQEYVDRNSTEFKQEVERITNELNNAEGVYGGTYEKIYETIGENQRPTGFKIIKNNDENSYWQFDYNGLRYTNNDGQSYKVGITNSGSILADNIVVGSVLSNTFQVGSSMYFDGVNDTITFGSGVTMSWDNITDKSSVLEDSDITISGGYVTKINNTSIETDHISASAVSTINLDASQITSGTISADRLLLTGNLFRQGTTTSGETESNFLLGINLNSNLQIGNTGHSSGASSTYTDVNIYTGGEVNCKSNASTYAPMVASTLTAKGISSTSTTSYYVLTVDSNGEIKKSNKQVSDIGSGGTAKFG